MTFLSNLFSLFSTKCSPTPTEKKIAFIDGDQPIPGLLRAYEQFLNDSHTETHLIRMLHYGANEPKKLQGVTGINKIYLQSGKKKKEAVDKFIAAYIQRAVSEGYTHVTVVSDDMDFFDIFVLSALVDPAAARVKFRLITPGSTCIRSGSNTAPSSMQIEVVPM